MTPYGIIGSHGLIHRRIYWAKFLCSVISRFSRIIETLGTYWIWRSYLSGVTAAQLWWHDWKDLTYIIAKQNLTNGALVTHDDVIKWRYFWRYWPFVRGIHRSPVDSPHKGQWRRALMFSMICARTNGWVNNRDAGDLRRDGAHYDVTVKPNAGLVVTVLKPWLWFQRQRNHAFPDVSLSIRQSYITLRPRKNGRHFADDIFKCIFLNETVWIPIEISQKFVPKGSINNIPSFVQIMVWRRPGAKPLSEPMMVSLQWNLYKVTTGLHDMSGPQE